jgi:hypothetical protein
VVQQREQKRAAHKKEERLRRRERREKKDEEFRLHEQQGLPPVTSEDSSSGEEEEEDDGGRALPDRWEPAPLSPRATEAAREQAPGEGAGVPVTRWSTREAARAAEVQWRSWRRPVPVRFNSVGDVVTVPGAVLQWQGWPHRADGDGEDRSRWPDVMV